MMLEVGYKTGSGNIMPMIIHGELLDRRDVPVGDQGVYCSHGGMDCKGYNGGCPPYAPAFAKIKKKLPYFYTIIVEFDMASALKFAGWTRGKSAPGLFILMYADRLTMNYTQRLLTHFENTGYFTVGASNCPGCKPKDCTVTHGGKCAKPKKRRFSLEAVGVECHKLHRLLFDEPLPWWYHTKEHMPTRMFRYAGIFTDKPVGMLGSILGEFVFGDKSYCDEVPDYSGDYETSWLQVPENKLDYGNYLVYRIPLERMK